MIHTIAHAIPSPSVLNTFAGVLALTCLVLIYPVAEVARQAWQDAGVNRGWKRAVSILFALIFTGYILLLAGIIVVLVLGVFSS